MKITVIQITIGTTVIALILFIAATIWASFYLSQPIDPTVRLEYLKFALEVYKAIGLGFLITLLGVAIPNILPEARYEFETLKEGREIYSRAKTGIDYLPYRLVSLDFKNGMELIESIHRLKHLADAFLASVPKAGKWPYDAYATIVACRDVVEMREDWNTLSPEQRLELFANVKLPKY